VWSTITHAMHFFRLSSQRPKPQLGASPILSDGGWAATPSPILHDEDSGFVRPSPISGRPRGRISCVSDRHPLPGTGWPGEKDGGERDLL